jgi:hypothetical protein
MKIKLTELLNALSQRPRIYLGEQRVDLAISFLIGLEFGSRLEESDVELFEPQEFQIWLCKKYDVDTKLSWDEILRSQLDISNVSGLLNIIDEFKRDK